MTKRPPFLVVAALAVSLACPRATAAVQESDRPSDRAAEEPARHLLDRVCVVGASVSRSFGLEHGLAEVLEATTARESDEVLARSDVMFFRDPSRYGREQVEWALGEDPSLVVGVDFLFWFGYGILNADGGALASEDERLGLLESGLALLDGAECPVVVGDFPDMSEAVGLMMRAEQVPAPETLDALNERLAAWAAERGNVIVLPFAEAVRGLRSDEAFRIGRWEWPAESSSRVLLPDRLHPTQEGLAAIAHLVAVELVEAGLAEEADFELEKDRVLATLAPTPEPAEGAGE